jgi:hypothetical protein
MRKLAIVVATLALFGPPAGPATAQDAAGSTSAGGASAPPNEAAVAQAIANPISSLISVPFQNNIDCCYGSNKVAFYTLNIQPVVPVSLSTDWNVIVRTIMPIANRPATAPGVPSSFGFGDVTQSFFFSPKASVAGLIIGAGPVFVYPLGNSVAGGQKWSAGPTIVVLKQQGSWTTGVLANQVWSFAGRSSRANVSALFLQPFVNYTMRDTTSFTLSSESTYNWNGGAWTAPVIFSVGKIFRFGAQLVQLQAGAKGYATTPAGGPGWGLRFAATLLFPRG